MTGDLNDMTKLDNAEKCQEKWIMNSAKLEKETIEKYHLVPIKRMKEERKDFCQQMEYDDLDFCEIVFQGFSNEIEKLKLYISKPEYYSIKTIKPYIDELRTDGKRVALDYIKRFPNLKATGFIEQSDECVYVFYSESGSDKIDMCSLAGAYDSHADHGAWRWAQDSDVLKEVETKFRSFSTGETVYIDYDYPYETAWNELDYIMEYEEVLYGFPKSADFIVEDGVLKRYRGRGGDIVIPDSVTKFERYKDIFRENTRITSVQIPGSIKSVCDDFSNCPSLRKIVLLNGVESIEPFAFSFCNQLSEVVLPRSMRRIGGGAFYRCNMLNPNEISGLEKLESIGMNAFGFCGAELNTVINYEKGIFLHFNKNENIADYRVPDGIVRLSDGAFADVKINTIIIPDTVETIGEDTFRFSSLSEIKLGCNVREIGNHVFYECKNLKKVVLSEKLERISDNAFVNCVSLEELIIPTSVVEIGKEAFFSCSRLKRIRIPGYVKTINDNTFNGCKSLESVIFDGDIKEINLRAFRNNHKLVNINLPDTITCIGQECFENCSSLLLEYLPAKLKKVGNGAFKSCESIKEITIGDSLNEISVEMFADCINLGKVVIGKKVRKIGGKSFINCTKLKDVYILSELGKTQGKHVFDGCRNVTIHGIPGSGSEQLAKEYGFRFVGLSFG